MTILNMLSTPVLYDIPEPQAGTVLMRLPFGHGILQVPINSQGGWAYGTWFTRADVPNELYSWEISRRGNISASSVIPNNNYYISGSFRSSSQIRITDDVDVSILLGAKIDPTTIARIAISYFPDREMAAEALSLLERLTEALMQRDGELLPQIQVFTPDDGSLLLEWTSRHWRIGFTLEKDRRQSGWYLVSDEIDGNVRAYGDFANVDVRWLVTWAFFHTQ